MQGGLAGMATGMAAQGVPGGGAHMGAQGAVGSSMFGGGFGGQGAMPQNNLPASPYGVVTCHICGKVGHYARNCWQAANRQKSEEENIEVRELLLQISKREKEEEDRKKKEVEEARKKEEDERRESEKLREEQAREAKLEATIVRILQQRKESGTPPVPLIAPTSHVAYEPKKRSPRSKARMLGDIRSYIAESEDDSEEVKEEAEKLVEALERRKNSRKGASTVRAAVSRAGKKGTPRKEKAQVHEDLVKDDGFETPKKMCVAECSGDGMIEFALT
ncbi:hypothetical protein CBR_g29753 [Chara braunii]|uniref:CCHC-type domain-containing protein n=1 Tax=Chara braunii TaxID=69332 RepID=A0A388LBA4_CHABU|nr:hypothetical protein CBR_g29753 [Chara braunii]|eukprot:GBG79605.1 hypothetical protein CBR_g29753 [Chara braunii]